MTASELSARGGTASFGEPPDQQLAIERYTSTFRAGPLPSPSDLAAYAEIRPDLVDRILSSSDEERGHRHRMDEAESRRASVGLGAGFAVAVMCLAVSAWLINNGHDVAGVILGSFDIVALTAVFVLGRRDPPQAETPNALK